jgi:hypothetical protein
MDPQRFVQCIVERGVVVSKLLPQHLLGLDLMGQQRACVTSLLPWARDDDVRGGQDRA